MTTYKFKSFDISVNEDLYINATDMCKIKNKKFYDFSRTEKFKTTLKTLIEETNLSSEQLIIVDINTTYIRY